MATQQLATVILAAGMGTRMRSKMPKVLHPLAGRPLINWVIDAASSLTPVQSIVVASPANYNMLHAAVPAVDFAVQENAVGTGDAVRSAMPTLADSVDIVLVLFGDTPLLQPATLKRLANAVAATPSVGMAVLGFQAQDPIGYGRLLLRGDGVLDRIVEEKDTTPEERSVDLCNGGVMAFRRAALLQNITRLTPNNAKGEYYLTDLVPMLRDDGLDAVVIDADEEEVMGINTRVELAQAESLVQTRLRRQAMLSGVTMVDPASVFLSYDTAFGEDVRVEPQVIFGPGVRVGDGVEIRGHSHLEGCSIASGALIGPFARLRPGADVGSDARVGNFVEVKAAALGPGAKVNHLSYIGDATVGARANVGAGTITCNYDGFNKHRTQIGDDAFIGSNSALVAPVEIGAGANVAAGSVITESVSDHGLAIARGKQVVKQERAATLRTKLKAIKDSKSTTPKS